MKAAPQSYESMTPLLYISGVPQAGSYQTRLRFAALRILREQLQWKSRQALTACYHHIKRPNIPAETVLVAYLPSNYHSQSQRTALQHDLMNLIGHRAPANQTNPFRNATMEFFEVVLSASTTADLMPAYNMTRQRENGNYYYYNGIKLATPLEKLINPLVCNLPTGA